MADDIDGKYLNKLWNVGAKHALYYKCGTWFHQLRRFPGALFDAEGYVVFETEEAFRTCPHLRIRKDVGCREGIRKIPGYVRCSTGAANDINQPSHPERVEQRISRIIRDTAISSELKLLYEHQCQICGISLTICGRNYCEAHHIKPLGSPHDGDDNQNNLVCVCPNCHVMLDYAAIPIRLDMLKCVKHGINQDNVDYHNALHRIAAQTKWG